jgi:hypothetical protein
MTLYGVPRVVCCFRAAGPQLPTSRQHAAPTWRKHMQQSLDAIIVGAGMAGIYAV